MNHPADTPTIPMLPSPWRYHWHSGRRGWSNFSFRRQRQFDAYLVTMHQSGTHWLKYLITLIQTREHGLPAPDNISEPLVIGGPRQPPRYAIRPRLGHSHTIPSPLLRLALAHPGLGFPDYLILVRDIRDVLIAHYRKWAERYDCSFSTFLRGDVSHRRFEKDIWWDFRFLNSWGAIAQAMPARTHVVRYETLRAEPAATLTEALHFLGVSMRAPDDAVAYALSNASKESMAEKDVAPYGMPIVNRDERRWSDWFNAADRAWLEAACARYLEHDFGYDYRTWA